MHCMGCGAEGDPMSNFIIDRGRMAHQHRPKEGGRGCGRAQGLQCASSIEHRAGSIGHPRLLRALPLLLLLPTALSPLPPSLFPPVPPSSRIWADVVGCGGMWTQGQGFDEAPSGWGPWSAPEPRRRHPDDVSIDILSGPASRAQDGRGRIQSSSEWQCVFLRGFREIG